MPMKELRDLEREILEAIPASEFRSLSFDPALPSGVVHDERGDGSLNIGVSGLLILVRCAGGAADRQLERLLDDASICRLRDWLPLFHHISHGTVPTREHPDERTALVSEYERNHDVYQRLGFPPPAIE